MQLIRSLQTVTQSRAATGVAKEEEDNHSACHAVHGKQTTIVHVNK